MWKISNLPVDISHARLGFYQNEKSKWLTALLLFSVSVFQSTSAKLAFRWEMRVGSCIAWSMEFSPTAKCPAIEPLGMAMTRSTPSLVRPARESMCHEQFFSTWNQRLSVSCTNVSIFGPHPFLVGGSFKAGSHVRRKHKHN